MKIITNSTFYWWCISQSYKTISCTTNVLLAEQIINISSVQYCMSSQMSSYCALLHKPLCSLLAELPAGNHKSQPAGPSVESTHLSTQSKTWRPGHRMAYNKARVLCRNCAVCLGSLSLTFTVNLHGLCLDRAQSVIQTNRLSNWQDSVFASVQYMEPGHTGRSCFDFSSSSHCRWARSYAANSLAWLAWKADSLLGRNEEFLHMYTWLMNKVWSLPTFFAQDLARRKAILADGPFD